MEEEEDDFYDPTDSVPATHSPSDAQQKPEETGDAEEEEVEVEDDEVGLRLTERLWERFG